MDKGLKLYVGSYLSLNIKFEKKRSLYIDILPVFPI